MFVEANNPTACPINPTLIDPRCVVRNPLRAQLWTTEDNKSPPAAPESPGGPGVCTLAAEREATTETTSVGVEISAFCPDLWKTL
jgi:hypothetical protein